jgi:hypothetical protein
VNKLAVDHSVVLSQPSHKPSIKERVAVKKQPEVIIKCVGKRKEPSKAAVDRFISIYLEMVKENQKKRA